MSAASDQLKCFCKCYNMLEWKKTFHTSDSVHVNEKPYSCGRCLKGFSPDDNVIVHKLIPTLNLLNSFNIFNKGAITKMHLTTYNIIHGSAIKLCSTKEGSKENLCSNSGNTSSTSQNFVQCNKRASISQNLMQCNKRAPCSGQNTNKSLTYNSVNAKHSKENPYACILCGRRFKWRSDLTYHQMVHVKEKRLHCCSECKRMFVREEHLVAHMCLHDPELPYYCSLCNNLFSNKTTLSMHIKYHIENSGDSYSCKTCKKSFLSKKEVIRHLSVHATENPCHICKGMHKLQNGFAFFYCFHTEGKRHVCNVCRKRFLKRTSLRYHLRAHHGKKPHVCNVCQEAYPHASGLDAHYTRCPTHNKSLPVCKETSTDVKDISDNNENNRMCIDAVTDGNNTLNNNEYNRMCRGTVTEAKNTLYINEDNRTSEVTRGEDTLDTNEQNRMSIDAVTDGNNTLYTNEHNKAYADEKDTLDIN